MNDISNHKNEVAGLKNVAKAILKLLPLFLLSFLMGCSSLINPDFPGLGRADSKCGDATDFLATSEVLFALKVEIAKALVEIEEIKNCEKYRNNPMIDSMTFHSGTGSFTGSTFVAHTDEGSFSAIVPWTAYLNSKINPLVEGSRITESTQTTVLKFDIDPKSPPKGKYGSQVKEISDEIDKLEEKITKLKRSLRNLPAQKAQLQARKKQIDAPGLPTALSDELKRINKELEALDKLEGDLNREIESLKADKLTLKAPLEQATNTARSAELCDTEMVAQSCSIEVDTFLKDALVTAYKKLLDVPRQKSEYKKAAFSPFIKPSSLEVTVRFKIKRSAGATTGAGYVIVPAPGVDRFNTRLGVNRQKDDTYTLFVDLSMIPTATNDTRRLYYSFVNSEGMLVTVEEAFKQSRYDEARAGGELQPKLSFAPPVARPDALVAPAGQATDLRIKTLEEILNEDSPPTREPTITPEETSAPF